MARRIRQMTVEQMMGALGAYRSLIAATLAVVLVLVFLPGTPERDDESLSAGQATTDGTDADGATDNAVDGTATASGGQAPEVPADGESGDAAAAAGAEPVGGDATVQPAPQDGEPDPPATAPIDTSSPSCDPATGRIRVPTKYAPPCVPPPSVPNGGATYQGVTEDTITVAVYRVQRNPAVDAVVSSAGADDSTADIQATFRDYVDYFQHHYETYGRKVELVFVEASGPPDDDVAARADARRVATEIKAFASWFDPSVEVGGTYAYVEELVARGVLCIICTYAQPAENYAKWAPYVWVPSMSYEQSADIVIEYIGKRLWGRKAQWSGDPTMQQRERSLGLIEYDNEAGDFSFAPAYWREGLARYGARLDDAVTYPFDASRAQTQSRTMVARLKDRGITTVIMYLDPIYPIFITGEATRQAYYPEWLITGVGLTDMTLFGRLYDQSQWANAFGVGWLPARYPQEQGDAYRLHLWHHGRPPKAENTYGAAYIGPWYFFTGVHLAGPDLTPQAYRDGLFRYPPSGAGITTSLISWGRHGLWSGDDYGSVDDVTEIWWDANAVGEDEIGNHGTGMYRYVDGGRRYRPGEWPTSDPKAFDPAGTVMVYDEVPEADRPPQYEHDS